MKRKAFTLVELIIVIAIVAILSVTAFLVVTKWVGKSRDARRQGDLAAVTSALMERLADPDQDGTLDVTGLTATNLVSWATVSTWALSNWTFGDVLRNANTDSLQKTPTDPSANNGTQEYSLGVLSWNKRFSIAASLEVDETSSGEATVRGNFQNEVVAQGLSVPSLVLVDGVTSPVDIASWAGNNFVAEGGANLPYSLTD